MLYGFQIKNYIALKTNHIFQFFFAFYNNQKHYKNSLKKVKNSVHLTNIIDETSKLCSWNIAMNHYFECWGDAMTYDGHVSIVQPQIMPLFDSRSVIQVLSPIVYSTEQSAYDTVKNVWKSTIIKSGNFEREWEKALHDGLY